MHNTDMFRYTLAATPSTATVFVLTLHLHLSQVEPPGVEILAIITDLGHDNLDLEMQIMILTSTF